MREKVCIVLNERESEKSRAAQALESRLAEFGITASRMAIDDKLLARLIARSPQMLVLDYLLGDFSTGLDILSGLAELDPAVRPRTIFLTDEPSVKVAVEAMRLGAINYHELDNAQSIELVAREVRDHLASADSGKREPAVIRPPVKTLDDLVAASESSRTLIRSARNAASKGAPIVALIGPEGCGKRTLARAIAHEDSAETFYREIDVRNSLEEYHRVFGLNSDPAYQLVLGKNLSLGIIHADEDDGELLELILENRERLWPSPEGPSVSRLILCLKDENSVAVWARALPVEVIRVPELSSRRDDIPAFVQAFQKEAEALGVKKAPSFPVELVQWLSQLSWDGDLRQLRAVVTEVVVNWSYEPADLRGLLENAREAWDTLRAHAESASQVDKLTAARMLEKCNFNYRIAAARLGCPISSLRAMLSTDSRVRAA